MSDLRERVVGVLIKSGFHNRHVDVEGLAEELRALLAADTEGPGLREAAESIIESWNADQLITVLQVDALSLALASRIIADFAAVEHERDEHRGVAIACEARAAKAEAECKKRDKLMKFIMDLKEKHDRDHDNSCCGACEYFCDITVQADALDEVKEVKP